MATLYTKMSVINKKANFSRQTQRTQSLKSRSINYYLLYTVFIEPSCTGTFNPLTTSSHVFVECSKTDATLVLIYFGARVILDFQFL